MEVLDEAFCSLIPIETPRQLAARKNSVPLHEALDQIARDEGFARWSLLSSQFASKPLVGTILSQLNDGDLLLVAARPGHGKTTLGLRLLLDAARDDRKAVFFTLEFTEAQARKHIRTLEKEHLGIGDKLEIATSDEISADYIIRHLSGSKPGTVAVIDYLQILDQQRSKPALSLVFEGCHFFHLRKRRQGLMTA